MWILWTDTQLWSQGVKKFFTQFLLQAPKKAELQWSSKANMTNTEP